MKPSARYTNDVPEKRLSSSSVVPGLLITAVVAACAAFGAEPAEQQPPRRGVPFESAQVGDKGPRISLKPAALERTLATILDGSQTVERRVNAVGVAALARLNEAVPALVKVLERGDNIDVKVAAVWALREIGDPAAIPALLKIQGQAVGPHPELRYDKKIEFASRGVEMTLVELVESAIASLGETVLGKYLEILEAPSSPYRGGSAKTTNRRRSALAVIVFVGSRDYRAIRAMSTILRAPDGAYPADFRRTAALGLARVLVSRTEEFAAVSARDKVAEEITRLLVDAMVTMERGELRQQIGQALRLSRPVYAVTLLSRHFVDNSPDEVRKRTIEALGLLRSRESVEALIWALQNEDEPELRWRAALGLGLAGKSEEAMAALTRALHDKSPAVRRSAVRSLGRIGGKGLVRLIGPRIRDKSPKVRAAAARALGMSGNEAAIERLVDAAGDENVVVRATAIAALGGLPSSKSLIAILKATKDDEPQVRFVALKVLEAIHNPHAYRGLLGLVSDPDHRIRSGATNALHIAKEHHPAAFKEALIRTMTHPDSSASADACDLADFPGDPAVIKALRAASVDKRPAVRASAIRMLEHMGLR